MQIKGFLLFIIVMLFIVTVAWIGITVYDSINNVEVNPNANSLRQGINAEFDTTGLVRLDEKVEQLPVNPDLFHQLEDQGLVSDDQSTDDNEIIESEE